MTRRVRRYLAASALVAALVGVSACDGDGEDPQTTGSETTSTETTTEPTTDDVTTDAGPTGEPPQVEEPTAPPEMAIDDNIGASATTYYFLQLYDYMRATGDTTAWDSLSGPECEWCRTNSQDARELSEDGGWAEGPALDFDITEAKVEFPGEDRPYYAVRLRVVQPPYTIVDGDGTATEASGVTLDPMVIATQYVDGRFIVVGVNFEAT